MDTFFCFSQTVLASVTKWKREEGRPHYVSKEDEEWGRGWEDQLTTIPPFFSSSSDQEKPPPPQDSFLSILFGKRMHQNSRKSSGFLKEIPRDSSRDRKILFGFFLLGKRGQKHGSFEILESSSSLEKKGRETDGLLALPAKGRRHFLSSLSSHEIFTYSASRESDTFPPRAEEKKEFASSIQKNNNPDSTHVAFAEKKSGMRKNTAKKGEVRIWGKYVCVLVA